MTRSPEKRRQIDSMKTPRISRPKFPEGYVDHPTASVSWEYVVQKLTEAKDYWLCSTRPDGRPHVIPRWAVFMNGFIYYDGSPETRHARNLETNPHIAIHLESGDEAVILEGVSGPAGKPVSALGRKLSKAYCSKYTAFGYAPEANQWDEGGLYVFKPRQCIVWTEFTKDPTKFVFDLE